MNFGDDEDEEKRLIKEIKLMMKNLENSELYAEMRLGLNTKPFRKHLSRVLGSYSNVQVVIYGLGSIEYNFDSLSQLAVLLQLKSDFSGWIGDVQIYDPVMSAVDIRVFEELDLQVLTSDQNCKRKAERPIMFYMPSPLYYLIGNLLGANWSSSCLNQILLLTNSFRETLPILPLSNRNDLETMARLQSIRKFTTEIDINPGKGHMQYGGLFKDFAWHFFDVDTNIDFDKRGWYPENELRDLLRDHYDARWSEILGWCRVPHHFRFHSVPLPPGWIKLKIYGIGTTGNHPGQFGGIFQDGAGEFLDRYGGVIDVEDNVIAGVHALKLGFARCKEEKPKAEKLFVESDNFMLVQYVCSRAEPDKKTRDKLDEVSEVGACFKSFAIRHVHEEANKDASDWVLRAGSERELKVGNPRFNMNELQLRQVSSVTEHIDEQDAGAKTADFDDDGGGLALNDLSRARLMAELDPVSVASSFVGTLGVPAAAPAQPAMSMPTPDIPSMEPDKFPSDCLLLMNMFDPVTEKDPDFDLAIKDDVKEECSKYGRVEHIHVDKNTPGHVYLQFDSVDAALDAQIGVPKRRYGGRLISAIFMQRSVYDEKFKGTG